MASVELSYYYGYEAEQFSFYRIPKLLFTDSRFAGISTDAKLLYGILLDRMSLSMKAGYISYLPWMTLRRRLGTRQRRQSSCSTNWTPRKELV